MQRLGTMMRRLILATALAALVPGCGNSNGKSQLTVSAAASLKRALTQYGHEFSPAGVRFSFAGSDQLAAQIRQGAKPDVFAAANTALPEALHRAGLVDRPIVFALNRLVIAVPAGRSRIAGIDDLAKPGTTIATGSRSVPVGAYTRTVLARLAAPERRAILGNVRSQEPDVQGVVGKLTQGAVDAGFVYATDVEAAGGRLRAIELPQELRPQVAYAVAVITGSSHRSEARAFIEGLLHGAGTRALRAAGFKTRQVR
jgi:molybdate transport system substrate-binding protein